MKLEELKLILIRLYKEYVKKHFIKIIYFNFINFCSGSTSATAWLLDPAIKKIFIDQTKLYLG